MPSLDLSFLIGIFLSSVILVWVIAYSVIQNPSSVERILQLLCQISFTWYCWVSWRCLLIISKATYSNSSYSANNSYFLSLLLNSPYVKVSCFLCAVVSKYVTVPSLQIFLHYQDLHIYNHYTWGKNKPSHNEVLNESSAKYMIKTKYESRSL